jgi:hypothetical protein
LRLLLAAQVYHSLLCSYLLHTAYIVSVLHDTAVSAVCVFARSLPTPKSQQRAAQGAELPKFSLFTKCRETERELVGEESGKTFSSLHPKSTTVRLPFFTYATSGKRKRNIESDRRRAEFVICVARYQATTELFDPSCADCRFQVIFLSLQ